MTPEQRQRISSMGGRAAHAQGKAHVFTTEEAKAAGRKGGHAHSSEHMAEIGRKGGKATKTKVANRAAE
jgi:general stress protein YciG